MRGVFISFEGMDGAGKSTQIKMLAARLRENGVGVLETREPGGCEIGEQLRKMVISAAHEIDGVAETLLMTAARREHIVRRIRPALTRGEWVLCDRFSDSTFAYQGGGRGVRREWIAEITREVEEGVSPDLTLYLLADSGSAAQPLLSVADNFETRDNSFYHSVETEYNLLKKRNPKRIVSIRAFAGKKRRARDEIAEEIYAAVVGRFSEQLP